MKYNSNFFLKKTILNIVKYGKTKTNYFKLKKIIKKIILILKNYFYYKIRIYLIKIKYRKGDKALIGEIGFLKSYKFNIIKNEK